MKRFAIIAVAGLVATPASAEDVERTIDAASDGHVDVSNVSGSVVVDGWSRNTVEVTGTLGRNVKELIVERKGDKIKIKVKYPRNSRSSGSDLHIQVPLNSSLDVGTVSADIDVTEVKGEQSLHTVSGDVTTEYTGADVEAESVSGDVEVDGNGADGEVEASTVSGDVTLSRVSGNVGADTVSGDVVIDEGKFSRVELGSVNGEIFFEGELLKEGGLFAETVNGDIEIELVGTISARFEIDTFNGSIDNCFGPDATRTNKYSPGWELEFTRGDGDGRVEISTLNGGVHICDD